MNSTKHTPGPVYHCTRWSDRLNRIVGNGWTNDLRGDLATNLPTAAAARKDYAERAAKAEAERIAQAITDAAYVETPGATFVGMDAAAIKANPERAKRTIRAAIMQAEGAQEQHLAIGLRYAKAAEARPERVIVICYKCGKEHPGWCY